MDKAKDYFNDNGTYECCSCEQDFPKDMVIFLQDYHGWSVEPGTPVCRKCKRKDDMYAAEDRWGPMEGGSRVGSAYATY